MTHQRAKSRTHATAPSYRRSQRDYIRHSRRVAKLERLRHRRCERSPHP